MSETMTGHCLCKAVQVKAPLVTRVEACHCSTCRRWGGGPLMVIHCGQNVQFEGQDHIQVFDSSDWADRGFCKACGTHLYYRFKPNDEYMVPVGLFPIHADFSFESQVFIDNKPDFYTFSDTTALLTEDEAFALYAPKE